MTGPAFAVRLEHAFEGRGTVHAGCVLVGAAGILIRGASGAGKSRLAFALIESGARLVADDRVHLASVGEALIARVPEAIAGLIELRGFGIVRLDHEGLARIRLVVDLAPAESLERLPGKAARTTEIQGVALPCLAVASGDPLAPSLVARALSGGLIACDGLALGQGALS